MKDPAETEHQLQSASQLLQKGELSKAESQYQTILKQHPNHPDVHFGLGLIYQKRGNFTEAIKYYQEVIHTKPDHVEALNNLGSLYKKQKKVCQAIQCYQSIIALQPHESNGYYCLGLIHETEKNLEEALKFYQKSAEVDENFFDAHYKVSKIYQQQGQLTEATQPLQKFIQSHLHHANSYFALGNIYQAQKRFAAARAAHQRALELNPNFAEAQINLGIALKSQGKFAEATAAYQRALELKPNSADTHNNLGNVLRKQGELTKAIAHYQQALQLDPTYARACSNLGNALKDRGNFTEAIAAYQQALKLNPTYAVAHSNLIFSLNYRSDYAPSAIYNEHRQWAERQITPFYQAISHHENNCDSNRQLRIGYVSGDFRTHSVAYFLEPLLATHNHSDFAIICYVNNKEVDETTRRMQQDVDGWRDVATLSDEQMVTLILQDQIDILVDLSGHTSGNRLLVFARKPAPVQVSYLGYPGTTGLDTMDYRLTDVWADPQGQTEHLHTEQLARLPHGFLCYQPPSDCPGVSPVSAQETESVTFGSFNNLAKVSPQMISHWAAILSAVPQSRIIIKARHLADPDTQNSVRRLFEPYGIATDRIELLGRIPAKQGHLALYNQIDIALDTFPYNGTTTTCEALWMGVPVVTLAGQTHASRVGVSLLTAVDLPELIADSAEDYVQKAIALASDRATLQNLRANLRDRMKASPLMDTTLITRSIETVYRTMWQAWCNDQKSSIVRQLQAASKLLNRGELELAKSQYQKVLEQDSHQAYANFCVGYIYQKQENIADAIVYYQRAIQSKPDYVEALSNLGNLQWKQGNVNEAIQCYQKSIELQPNIAFGYYSLGLVYAHQRRFEEALAMYQKAIELGGDSADTYCKMGLVFRQQNKLLEAHQHYQRAIQIQPDHAAAYFGLGFIYNQQAQISEAITAYQQAILLNSEYAAAHNNLGNIFRSQGKLPKAIAAYRRALQFKPHYATAHTNLLFTLNGCGNYENVAIYQEHRRWASCHAASLMPVLQRYDNDCEGDRRLRIGYVSGDLRAHSVAYFLEPLLAAHNHDDFEIICYANNLEVDETTKRLQQLVDGWKNITLLSDDQVVTVIHQDAIDILIDLSGHTDSNRLRVFAHKPAPIQVSYIGYPNTTGLDTINYRFTDAWADPEGQTEALHTEELVRLPHGFLCYRPLSDCPDVGPLPSTVTDYITFGCFNDLSKVNPQLVAQWSAILAAFPNAKLIVKAKSLVDRSTQDYLYSLFQEHGIAEDRVERLGQIPSQIEHLALYNRVDIALDTFPYNGTTTTCEALWMGVPVITLAGQTHVSRVGGSLLSAVGLPELIADSAEDYVQKAIALASDRTTLQNLRANLRDRMEASPLMDANLITRSVEKAYRQMWQAWCSHTKSTGSIEHIHMNARQFEPSIKPRRLHIGGKVKVSGWEVLNAVPAPYVDHIGNANDLSRFADNTFTDIYASHLVEHLDYKNELVATLKEWYRVLVPGGKVYISVPDLDVLAKLFLEKEKNTLSERFLLMRMMFGGHVDQYDYHLVGLNQEFLTMYLEQAGYHKIRKAEKFGFFKDTSNLLFKNVPISINLIAEKPDLASESTSEVRSQKNSQTLQNLTQTAHHHSEAPASKTITVGELLQIANDLGAQGKTQEAADCYRKVLSINPKSFPATVNLANMLKAQGMYSAALDYYHQALALMPNHPIVENNLAGILKDQGLIDEALAYFRKAVETNPSLTMAQSNLLLTLNYGSHCEPSAIYDEHRKWASLCATPLAQEVAPHNNEPDPERRLRIGYVSSDFWSHSVAYFFEPLLVTANRQDFEVICYANGTRKDATTERLQQLADGWRHIQTMTDEQLVAQVRQDKIDILVDLSGHTSGNRLMMFARKPAPVQVSYLGYPNTTGLATMAYRFTDKWADPEGQTEHLHTEQLVRLPHGFLCYQPPSAAPDVSSLPALDTGRIIFGSFNNLAKVSPQLIEHWSAILLAVPQARIVVKARPLADPGVQGSIVKRFQQNGIPSDRIELLGRIPSLSDHLALYSQIDIALDTFPYNGTTTTCEAMWMGIPVITLAGQTHASRVGNSLLSSVGLADLVATSLEDYIQKAIALANDLERLQHLRENLRMQMQQAPLTNARLIVQSVESAYRTMWRRWCNN